MGVGDGAEAPGILRLGVFAGLAMAVFCLKPAPRARLPPAGYGRQQDRVHERGLWLSADPDLAGQMHFNCVCKDEFRAEFRTWRWWPVAD